MATVSFSMNRRGSMMLMNPLNLVSCMMILSRVLLRTVGLAFTSSTAACIATLMTLPMRDLNVKTEPMFTTWGLGERVVSVCPCRGTAPQRSSKSRIQFIFSVSAASSYRLVECPLVFSVESSLSIDHILQWKHHSPRMKCGNFAQPTLLFHMITLPHQN